MLQVWEVELLARWQTLSIRCSCQKLPFFEDHRCRISYCSKHLCQHNALMLVICAQCIARDVDGKREVAGVHWDYDCYGAPGKIAQVCLHLCVADQASTFMSQPSASRLCAQLLQGAASLQQAPCSGSSLVSERVCCPAGAAGHDA